MSPFFVSRYRRTRIPIAICKPRWRVSPFVLCMIAFTALCAAYVWQMTALAMRGYVYNSLLRERSVLTENLQRAQFSALEQQSLARVEERLHEVPLVRNVAVDYITREDMQRSLSFVP